MQRDGGAYRWLRCGWAYDLLQFLSGGDRAKRWLARHAWKCAAGDKVVDMGCGTGINLDALSQFGRVAGVDVSETALSFCRERKAYRLCQAPVSDLPFRSESIQLLTAFDVLEHCEDDRAVLKEAFRACSPGGWVVFTVPAYQFMWGDHDVVAKHYRR